MTKVFFENPDYRKLRKERYTCVDMHCHTRYSDGLAKIKSIYKKCRKKGFGVAITDHNEIKGALKLAKRKDILVIPGIETTSGEGIHTLFYFYSAKELEEFHKKVIKPNISENPYSDLNIGVAEIIERAKKFNCKICSAHPFAIGHTGFHKFAHKRKYQKILRLFDFVEAVNGSNLHKNNINSMKWGRSIGKPLTGGSDAHSLNFVGKVVTAVKNCKSRREFLDCIGKDSIVVGSEVNSALLVFRHVLKIRMMSKFPKFYIKKVLRELLRPE